MWPALIATALGGFMQHQQNDMASTRADRARGAQEQFLKAQKQLFDQILSIAKTYDRQGAFDPDKQIAQLDQDVQRNSQREMANAAGALRTAGYRQGDSVIPGTIAGIGANARASRDRLATDIYTQAPMRKLAAYSAANPGSLNAGIGAYGERAQMYDAQQKPLGGMLSDLAPYLMPKETTGTVSGWSLPNGVLGSYGPPSSSFDPYAKYRV